MNKYNNNTATHVLHALPYSLFLCLYLYAAEGGTPVGHFGLCTWEIQSARGEKQQGHLTLLWVWC